MHDAAIPRHLQKIWDGTPLERRRVLVRCYHGLGDTIQFARYLPAVCAVAREVIVWTQPQLMPLIQSVSEGLIVLPLHDGVPDVDYDVDIEIMELPYAFNMTLETPPASVPYLHVPGNSPGAPRAPSDADGRSIGIAWRAGDWNPARSIDFASLTAWFDDTDLDVRWQSLQFDARPTERHVRLMPFQEIDLCDTAARMQSMALVISVDSMPAHLAGALGVPVWTLLPHDADWRWLEHRSDSQWYPTMRLFRQSRQGRWDDVLGDVRRALGHPACFHSQREHSANKGRRTDMASAQQTVDHDEIRRWAEARDGKPACVKGTGGKDDVGMLRIDFPGYSGGDTLQEISWDEWFQQFDDNDLALLIQERTADGELSTFNKLVKREH